MKNNYKLSIVIPVYNETFEVLKPMLDSIAIQQNVNMKDIEVVVVNDGGSFKMPDDCQAMYPFDIHYYIKDHNGVSAARNYGMDKAKGEYIQFADCDDMFFNACGLHIVFNEINNGGFDTLVSAFVEETRFADQKTPAYINHDIDTTFVHGKIHNRNYLIKENIRWNESLTIHEDSYFNCLCQKLSTNGKYCPTAFYLWKWRDDSVCRHDPLYLNKTMVNMLNSNTALVKEFLRRGKKNDAAYYATAMIYDIYYGLNCDRWWTGEGHGYLEMTEKRFKKYWEEFKGLFNSIPKESHAQIIMGIKNRMFSEGLLLERITFEDWIKHIENI